MISLAILSILTDFLLIVMFFFSCLLEYWVRMAFIQLFYVILNSKADLISEGRFTDIIDDGCVILVKYSIWFAGFIIFRARFQH